MSVTINETSVSGPQVVHIAATEPTVEIRDRQYTVENIGVIREEKLIVSDAANFAPAGPPGPAGPMGPAGDGQMLLEAHIVSATPHPAYDIDMPTLNLIFENGLI